MTADRLIVVETSTGAPGEPDSTGARDLYNAMSAQGISVDLDGLNAEVAAVTARRDRAQNLVDDLTGIEGFKPNSKKMMNEWLAKSKRGPLASIKQELLPAVLSQEELNLIGDLKKQKKTLQDLNTLRKHTDEDGMVRPTWTEALTGRWYTGEPPIQTLSAEVRKFLVPRPGNGFTTIDWHQHELRILARLTEDPDLQAIFESGADPHLAVYERTTGIKLSEDPAKRKAQRDIGKMLNYALVYGIGPEGLAARLGITDSQGQDLIDKHFAAFPVMAKWIRKTAIEGMANGYTTTISGRRIPVDTTAGTEEGGRAWREAVNYTLQGSSSDHMTDLLNRLRDDDGGKYFEYLRAQMHDAVLIDAPLDQRKEIENWFQEQMEAPFKGILVPSDSNGPSANWKDTMDGLEIDLDPAKVS